MLSSLLPHTRRTEWYETRTEPTDCIYFYTKNGTDTIKISTTKKWDGTIQYSTNKTNWYTWTGAEVSGTELYFRGTNNTVITNTNGADEDTRWTITCNSEVACNGDIESLRNYSGTKPTMANNCYGSMFYNDTKLVKAPKLTSTRVTLDCYSDMFRGCTALKIAPALPAMTLADMCYQFMFFGCTSLTTAPALPATTLAYYCYFGMFQECTSLTRVPALPATSVVSYCYMDMFYDCSSLKVSNTFGAPYIYSAYYLPSEANTSGSYSNMFYGTGGTYTASAYSNTWYYTTKPVVS